MRQVRPEVSERRVCRLLHVGRSTVQRRPVARGHGAEPPWVPALQGLIRVPPIFGSRRLWALLCRQRDLAIHRKAVYRVLRQRRWLVHQRLQTSRRRARGLVSRAHRSNERWAMDVTPIPCGRDGWAHLAAVIDCHDREVVGYEFALIFQSRRFRAACRDYRLRQEFITPYTPEQNGIIERFFRSLKRKVSGSISSRPSTRPVAASATGSTGITSSARIKHWGIAASAVPPTSNPGGLI